MTVQDPALILLELWRPNWTRAGWLGEWDDLDVTSPARGPAALTVKVAADQAPAELWEPGMRLVAQYRPQGRTPSGGLWPLVQLCSGRISVEPSGPAGKSTVAVSLVDDWTQLDVLSWPVPAAALTAQTVEQWHATGPAEDVICSLVQAAVTRLGLPITVPASAHRGATITVDTRMESIADVVQAAADAGGLSVRVRQGSSGLTLQVGVGTARPWRLTESGGTVTTWRWRWTPPTVTRAVVGGRGEGAARTFVSVVDATAETTWKVVREKFIDARNVDETLAGTALTAALTARGQAAIDAGMARIDGLSITVAESEAIRYGATLTEHDQLTVELVPGVARTARISEVRVTASTSSSTGVTVTPVLGDPTVGLPEREQALIIASLSRGMARLRAR